MKHLGHGCDRIALDEWDSFVSVFAGVATLCGKQRTQGIEGSNCRPRHEVRRAFRRGRNFPKKLLSRLKVFSPAFHCLNHGRV